MNNLNLLFLLVALIYSSRSIGAMTTYKPAGENLQVRNLSYAPFYSPRSRDLQVSIDELLEISSGVDDHDDDVPVEIGGLEYDFYRHSCPQAEATIRAAMARVHKDVPPALLRLFFHDCFIKGCDASVLLDDSNGNTKHQIERKARPNLTLKGFNTIDSIKNDLEKICPGVVSCADIISIATRDGIVLSGGPFYPLLTGRRDSPKSFFEEANADIPKPNSNISETLRLFSSRGFNPRETVALLGGHGVGKIGCNFVEDRINNFQETGRPDPTMKPEFVKELRLKCSRSTPDGGPPAVASRGKFDSLYYKNLVRGRGVLISDQELMNNAVTRQVVALYASDDGTLFRNDFARSMLKLSNLNVLTATQGHGCDASILLDSAAGIISEKISNPNRNSARGFEVIDEIKYALEKECPRTVSCADILALAARDSTVLAGGPSWEVPLGRRDSRGASLSGSNNNIPAPNNTFQTILTKFKLKGLDLAILKLSSVTTRVIFGSF